MRPPRLRAIVGLLAAVLAALVVASAWLWSARPTAATAEDWPSGAVTTAREAARLFFTLDAEHAEADTARLLAMTTGQFRTDYQHQRDRLVQQVTSKGLHITASTPNAGAALEDFDGNRAQVLVGVDAATAVRGGAIETDNYRVRVLLLRGRGHWLVSGLEQVG